MVMPEHSTLGHAASLHGGDPRHFMLSGILEPFPFGIMLLGIATAWYLYIRRPDLPGKLKEQFIFIYNILDHKYGFDDFNQSFFAGGSRKAGNFLWRFGDVKGIDGVVVNGSAKLVGWVAGTIRQIQSGYLYHYAFAMIIGLLVLVSWVLARA